VFLAAAALLAAAPGFAGAPAARAGDRTTHAGAVMAPASPNVFIQGQPAARLGDRVWCPQSTGGVPHGVGVIIRGSATVLINGQPAARAGDLTLETDAASTLLSGGETVLIGP
jgi:uncharacterized Zn-binding protein involved in type VI secretion